MNICEVNIQKSDLHKLLSAASGDAALLYLYISGGNNPAEASQALHISQERIACGAATLRQLGLWPETRQTPVFSGERPQYGEQDIMDALDRDKSFSALYGEVQRLLGRSLNTEELKILLGFVRYLGLPAEVISVLVCYCRDKARQKGHRTPSLRAIEKEAYAWAEQGVDTMEEAAAYIQRQNQRNTRLSQLKGILQIHGRNLTAGEQRYAQQWIDWGFANDAIALAYERTCLNTGGLSWAYMNKILLRWQENGLLTAQQVENGDKKVTVPKGATGNLVDADYEAIARLLQED